jgi:hypothetical protein
VTIWSVYMHSARLARQGIKVGKIFSPSLSSVLPSSHSSSPAICPSPQRVSQVSGESDDPPLQCHPQSMPHVALHPGNDIESAQEIQTRRRHMCLGRGCLWFLLSQKHRKPQASMCAEKEYSAMSTVPGAAAQPTKGLDCNLWAKTLLGRSERAPQ